MTSDHHLESEATCGCGTWPQKEGKVTPLGSGCALAQNSIQPTVSALQDLETSACTFAAHSHCKRGLRQTEWLQKGEKMLCKELKAKLREEIFSRV